MATATPKIKALSALGVFVQKQFDVAKRNRESSGINAKLLKSQKQYDGVYDCEVLAEINSRGGSSVYRRLTASKSDALVSWLMEGFHADEKAWSIKPTPIPDLPEELKNKVKLDVTSEVQRAIPDFGDNPAAMEEAKQLAFDKGQEMRIELLEGLKQEAQLKSEAMEAQIEDQLVESNWRSSFSDMISNYSKFQSAFLKGPIIEIQNRLKNVGDEQQIVKKPVLTWYAPNPYDIYPSIDANNVQEGRIFEIVRFSRERLDNLRMLPHYNNKVITKLLTQHVSPIREKDTHISTDREELENKDKTNSSDSETLYEGVEMWGSVAGWMLAEMGIPVEDKGAGYEAHVIIMGGEVIYATLNENLLNKRPYYQAWYRKVSGSFWGISLPESMQDIAKACNGSIRALLDNLSIASGPMIAYDLAQVPPEEDTTSVYPWKVMLFDGQRSFNTRKAVEYFQPNSNADELLRVYDHFKHEADDVTGIPSFAQGSTSVKGAGSALANYEKILTPDGSVEIGKIKQGDFVLNNYGSTSTVLNVYPQGVTNIFRLKFSNGEHIDCDMNHRWSVSKNSKKGFKTLTTEQIIKKGLFWKCKISPNCHFPKWLLPKIDKTLYPDNKQREDVYIIGYEYLKRDFATCIEVDSKNHLFVCENYIPTHNTASGLSILQSNLTKGIREHLSGISLYVLEPAISNMYNWNMRFNPRKEIKGDSSVIINGPLTVTTRETKAMRLNEFLNTLSSSGFAELLEPRHKLDILQQISRNLELKTTKMLPTTVELDAKIANEQALIEAQSLQEGQGVQNV